MTMILTNCETRHGIERAWEILSSGGSALDAVECAARIAEADTRVRTVGRGAAPNLMGEMEFDAAIMDGAGLRAGAVAALRDRLHAVSVARAVMERTPHVMLVAEGAVRFAAEIGAERAAMLTPEAQAEHEAWLETHVGADDRASWPAVALVPYAWLSGKDLKSPAEHPPDRKPPAGSPPLEERTPRIADTGIALAIDADGHLAAATTSSGWARKYPGRVGDSAIIGAGLYAEDRAGACACTHTGEMTMRCSTARMVVAAMRRGATVEEACHEAMTDLAELREGYLGPVMIHAIDRGGRPYALGLGDLQGAEQDAWMGDTSCDGPARGSHGGVRTLLAVRHDGPA